MGKLSIQNVSYHYRDGGRRVDVLRDVNFSIAPGQFITLIGASGSGKSTLLKLIAGLLQPDTGSIKIDGTVYHRRTGRTAYMPQADALLPWRQVLDNVVLGAEVGHGNVRKARQKAKELLPLFGLEGFADAFPTQLSGGMRQRAAFLRTFLSGQDLLLLDEPFGALDELTRRELQKWLLEIWQQFGYTILFVTHDVEEALFMGDRVLVLSQRPGQIVQDIMVPVERPRHEQQFSPEMITLQKQLLNALESESA